MPYWTVYVSDVERASVRTGMAVAAVGEYVMLMEKPPNMDALAETGFACKYFGEDKPDLERLIWSPSRLTYVERRTEHQAAGAHLDSLSEQMVAHRERMDRHAGAIADVEGKLAELSDWADRARRPWWKRIALRRK